MVCAAEIALAVTVRAPPHGSLQQTQGDHRIALSKPVRERLHIKHHPPRGPRYDGHDSWDPGDGSVMKSAGEGAREEIVVVVELLVKFENVGPC